MVFQAVLLSISVVAMVGVIVIAALVFKARKDKMMKAASPPLLYLMLIGAFVLYSEAIIGWLPAGSVTCMARPWIRHVGFSITYGALLIKTWRISAIMRLVKAKVAPTKDGQLFRAVAILILISAAYMLVWTLADPLQPTPLPRQQDAQADDVTQAVTPVTVFICILPWWDYIISAGEFCFLVWGGTLCYQARKAPDIYNETRPISYALWNEALWNIFYIYASCLLSLHPTISMNYLLCFLRVQCTITVTLFLLFVPKFRAVYSTLRELRGTVADVYGAKRVHRLSLMISKNGTIKTIYCIPCGPLTYTEGAEEDSPDSVSETGDNNKENHYTKAEVDALIEMVSRLKNERSIYKTQVRRLYHLLKEYKHRLPINSLPVYLVAETPEQDELPNSGLLPTIEGLSVPDTPADRPPGGALWQDVSSTSAYSSARTLPNDDSPERRTAEGESGTSCDPDYGRTGDSCALMTSHSRKASTVTTYLSAGSDNNSWTGDGSEALEEDLLRYAQTNDVIATSTSTPSGLTSPTPDYRDGHVAGQEDADRPPTAANRSRLTLDIPNQTKCAPLSPDSDATDDYPRLVDGQTQAQNDIQNFISTICGAVKDGEHGDKRPEGQPRPEGDGTRNKNDQLAAKCHEMDTLKNGKSNNILSNAVKLSAKAFDRRRRGTGKAADKMSFVMYI